MISRKDKIKKKRISREELKFVVKSLTAKISVIT
jgi:hypothetical protein